MSETEIVRRVGFTGHQGLTLETEEAVADRIKTYLAEINPSVGLCSLAEGADQIFAESLLNMDSKLVVIVPCHDYESTFTEEATLASYRRLLSRSEEIIELDFPSPTEDAFWAAGQRVVEGSDELIAVWDGEKSKGKGGTADVVSYARDLGRYVEIVWPEGSARK